MNYIDRELDSELSLEQVAEKAHYSSFHFHRIFKAVIGETLHSYINRRRIEKSAIQLISNRAVSISELSLAFGFSSNSAFTKAFKNFYGMSPSAFRNKNKNFNHVESKIGQKSLFTQAYICNIKNHLNFIKMNASIEVKHISELNFAGITHLGIQGIEHTFGRLISWAAPKGLMHENAKLGRIFYDSFKVTSPDKVRMSVCIKMDNDFKQEGEITKVTVPESKCIVGRFEINPMEFEQAWSSLFIWMNENEYTKSPNNPFEIYHNDFREHPEQKSIVDFYIPIL